MAETPMCAAELMLDAFDKALAAHDFSARGRTHEDEVNAMRSALRALAESEPTEKMVEGAAKGVRLLDADEDGQASYATAAEKALKWGILAAAEEGEQK